MNWILSYNNYTGDEYWDKFVTHGEATNSMNSDINDERQNLINGGYEFRLLELNNKVELYVPANGIYHTWIIETMDGFCERMWVELIDVPMYEDDTGRLRLEHHWFEFEAGAEREEDI